MGVKDFESYLKGKQRGGPPRRDGPMVKQPSKEELARILNEYDAQNRRLKVAVVQARENIGKCERMLKELGEENELLKEKLRRSEKEEDRLRMRVGELEKQAGKLRDKLVG